MKKIKFHSGITLIELIIVISILGIVISIVIPKIEMRDYYLMTNSRMLRDDIRNARYTKMVEGKGYRISLEGNQYVIMENTRIIKKVKLEKDFKIAHNFTGSYIYFSYNGSPSPSGGTMKIFDNKTNKYCEITIIPDTGRILLKNKIFEGYSGKR